MADECTIMMNLNKASGDKTDALGTGEGTSGGGGRGFTSTSCVAPMPTERYATEYNMKHKNRGLALIFNHENYTIPNLKPRTGTDIDCDNLCKALTNLDFDVKSYKDCKFIEIRGHVEDAASIDHSDNDCIVVVIMSHGEHDYIYAKDVLYKLNSLCYLFTANNCPTLAGKPKLFIIQACQGDHLDSGILLTKTETDGESSMSYKIPVHADFLLAYSTIPGFYSWRNPEKGSWFIQSLIQELNTNGKRHDILTLLTSVIRRVAFDFESCVPDCPIMHQQKQTPCVTSMLTRLLYFNDKNNRNG